MNPRVSPTAGSELAEADVVVAARNLIPQVLAAREECETLRRVPTPMVEALAEAGLLQMYLPRSMGGPELPPLVVFRVIEEISRADGSIGWCTMIATGVSNSMGLLEAAVGREMAGCPADMRLAGSIRPMGRARPVDGGHRIDGRWDFASGVNHARWLMCPCVIWDDGEAGHRPLDRPRLLGHEHDAHAPFANLLQEFVGTDLGAGLFSYGQADSLFCDGTFVEERT
jgi:alkylation response protein AidB-like acyl-CoA dehydrogenase